MFLIRTYFQVQTDYENIFTEMLHQSIRKLVNKFKKNGTVTDAPHSGQPHSLHTKENIETIAYTYVKNPAQSAGKVAHPLGGSLCRIMKDIGRHVYHLHLLKTLTEDDPDQPIEFCEH